MEQERKDEEREDRQERRPSKRPKQRGNGDKLSRRKKGSPPTQEELEKLRKDWDHVT